jgi:Zn ribbon nucleic-acid-binding protein
MNNSNQFVCLKCGAAGSYTDANGHTYPVINIWREDNTIHVNCDHCGAHYIIVIPTNKSYRVLNKKKQESLVPCPYCQSTFLHMEEHIADRDPQEDEFFIKCNTCKAEGSHCDNPTDAIKSWNNYI